ncbi:bifunctional metallophosphatase/5'-nucleotidase [Nonomuraea cavernae]|uniref:Bifunctional metallophosphatase/5'-nucleotidase n=1 Tax=Nonomuraea cavernae TaxID=2045107 RepID=A0A917YQ46_9ACTN|nr:bifunctional metallophosphatase/5'-nucleotidase [Nonomuraea cavernae]MCA2184619.1 bifunctional metallophosphatase/5'-nucleotidase [Nonomuraea cavernae]GGO63246.1 hypothetical protein GCM10012289_09800 [Nonomuraea cavernae]
MVTTDVHSSLENPAPMLAHLHHARTRYLVADCGDWFEGSGYYTLGGGVVERHLLGSLYDVIAPGNHGWRLHLTAALRPLTVCANVTDPAGNLLWRPLHEAVVAGRQVAVTAVIGEQAFAAIPAAERADARLLDPAEALRRLMGAHRADAWIVLSHSGYDHDLHLAEACPGVDVIFAGHCHSDRYEPTAAGSAWVVKGHELGMGYALARPTDHGWQASVHRFPHANQVPAALKPVMARIERMRGQLAEPVGSLTSAFRNRTLIRAELLTAVAADLRLVSDADAVVLNQTCLRTADLGSELTRGDLLTIEPFGNQLVTAAISLWFADNPAALVAMLTDRAGPIITDPAPLPPGLHRILTTSYLATNFLDPTKSHAGPRLAEVVQQVLTGDYPDQKGRRRR